MKNAWAQITLTSEDLVLTPRTCEELAPTSLTCEELVPTNKHLVLTSATGVRLYFFFSKIISYIFTRVRNHLQNLCTFLGFNNFNAAIFVLFPLNKLLLRDTLWYEMKIHVQQHEVFLSNDALKIFSPRVNIIVVKTFQTL